MSTMNFPLKGGELTLRQTEVAKTSSSIKKLTETYDEHAKIVFIFDVSGSMSSRIFPEATAAPVAPLSWEERQKLGKTRMELVKEVAREQIEARYRRYPDSRVSVVQFGSGAETIFDEGRPEELWPVLSKLTEHGHLSGGTEILKAIRKAMTISREKPSPVGIHHFVLVTDGGDSETYQIDGWLPSLKASGVVLDYIHIGDEASVNDPMRKACAALGGELVVVDTIESFKERFIAAATRPMLPPPAE